ncbi:MAG: DUF1800 domain-containing protein [Isosphaeraceae bacterium]
MRLSSSKSLLDDPSGAWAPFELDRSHPWDLASVSHLHRRAGFAAGWSILQRDLRDGPSASIDRLLAGEPDALDGSPAAEFEAFLDAMAAKLAPSADLTGLQAIWLYRMIFTPHPLQERMTLFWHGHFATSIAKVQSPALMQRQNNLLRGQALGDFRGLLRSIGRDPAMLIWLDSTINRKARPNENYAREVMELFSLGRGHYSEKDIQEAARAFTGWFVIRDEFQEVPRQHDDGIKLVLGRSGNWSGDDIPAILLEQSACAEWICRKLFRYFISESHSPSESLLAPLARAFRESNYQIKVPVSQILRSRLFFDPIVRRRRVKSPVEFTVGTIRALEILKPTVEAARAAEACATMGQSLYAPPSVAGWEAGPAWVNSTTMLARANLALRLLSDDDAGLGRRCNPREVAARYGFDRPEQTGPFLLDLLVPGLHDPKVRDPIVKAAASRESGSDSGPRDATQRILTLPEYQLA